MESLEKHFYEVEKNDLEMINGGGGILSLLKDITYVYDSAKSFAEGYAEGFITPR